MIKTVENMSPDYFIRVHWKDDGVHLITTMRYSDYALVVIDAVYSDEYTTVIMVGKVLALVLHGLPYLETSEQETIKNIVRTYLSITGGIVQD